MSYSPPTNLSVSWASPKFVSIYNKVWNDRKKKKKKTTQKLKNTKAATTWIHYALNPKHPHSWKATTLSQRVRFHPSVPDFFPSHSLKTSIFLKPPDRGVCPIANNLWRHNYSSNLITLTQWDKNHMHVQTSTSRRPAKHTNKHHLGITQKYLQESKRNFLKLDPGFD